MQSLVITRTNVEPVPIYFADKITVYAAALWACPQFEDECAHYLSTKELSRANKFATGELRRRFVIRRGFLRILLGRRLGMAPDAVPLIADEHGRLTLQTQADVVDFNLSHSNDLALIALGPGRTRIGIDVECVRPLEDLNSIVETAFSSDEHLAFRALADEERLVGFYIAWTRKEAYLKALGLGLLVPLSEVSVSLCFADTSPPRSSLSRDMSDFELRTFEPIPGYMASLSWHAAAS